MSKYIIMSDDTINITDEQYLQLFRAIDNTTMPQKIKNILVNYFKFVVNKTQYNYWCDVFEIFLTHVSNMQYNYDHEYLNDSEFMFDNTAIHHIDSQIIYDSRLKNKIMIVGCGHKYPMCELSDDIQYAKSHAHQHIFTLDLEISKLPDIIVDINNFEPSTSEYFDRIKHNFDVVVFEGMYANEFVDKLKYFLSPNGIILVNNGCCVDHSTEQEYFDNFGITNYRICHSNNTNITSETVDTITNILKIAFPTNWTVLFDTMKDNKCNVYI